MLSSARGVHWKNDAVAGGLVPASLADDHEPSLRSLCSGRSNEPRAALVGIIGGMDSEILRKPAPILTPRALQEIAPPFAWAVAAANYGARHEREPRLGGLCRTKKIGQQLGNWLDASATVKVIPLNTASHVPATWQPASCCGRHPPARQACWSHADGPPGQCAVGFRRRRNDPRQRRQRPPSPHGAGERAEPW